jgi:hypothetical protein
MSRRALRNVTGRLFPIYLPLWLSRRLPMWWRVRRAARIVQQLNDTAERALLAGEGGWPPFVKPLPPRPPSRRHKDPERD